MVNDLVTPDRLSGFPGAPFSDEIVDTVVAELRAHAGWHIAPERFERATLDSDGGTRAILPTLRVVAIQDVRDSTSEPSSTITGYRWSASGILSRHCWPAGFRSVEVDFVHGYEYVPADLLPAIAAACQSVAVASNVSSQSNGPFAISYRTAAGSAASVFADDHAVARYRLPSRP